MRRTINKAGLDLVRYYEKCRLTAYICPAGKLTIGWGHTGPDVRPGMKITRQRADELLAADLARFERFVDAHGGACTSNQFSALVSFAYNCGEGNFEESTLLRLHRAGKYEAAKQQFYRWIHGGGKVLQGLVERRDDEARLYATPDMP